MPHTKVLLVEDDYNWLKIFNTLVGDLTPDLFDYTHAIDTSSAISLIKNNKFDLLQN